MSTPQRQWNVVATLTVVVVLTYLGACAAAFFMGKVDAAMFKDMALPVVTAVLGYLAALLGKRES